MTNINTIIEEEKKAFWDKYGNPNSFDSISQFHPDVQGQLPKIIDAHTTTAMHRAYEAGRADWLRGEIEKLEGEIDEVVTFQNKKEEWIDAERIEIRNKVFTSIITRYKEELSELNQPNK